jgi:hypothetical protein
VSNVVWLTCHRWLQQQLSRLPLPPSRHQFDTVSNRYNEDEFHSRLHDVQIQYQHAKVLVDDTEESSPMCAGKEQVHIHRMYTIIV